MRGARGDLRKATAISAIEENLFSFLVATGGWPAIEVHDEPELLWTISDIPFAAFNLVCRARLVDAAVAATIEAAKARARARQVPLSWITGPCTEPPSIPDLLLEHGFALEERVPGMACDLGRLPAASPAAPGGLTIETVATDDALECWSATCSEVGELPAFAAAAFGELARHAGYRGPTYHYLAYLEGAPVATLTLHLTAGVAGLYDGGTLPQARGRGIFACMMQTAMSDARRRGYGLAILHATDMSLGQCRRLGFQEYCAIDQYLWEPDVDQ